MVARRQSRRWGYFAGREAGGLTGCGLHSPAAAVNDLATQPVTAMSEYNANPMVIRAARNNAPIQFIVASMDPQKTD
jgi:hypothetical protein